MFINYISKPIFLYTLLVALLGAFLSVLVAMFMPSDEYAQKSFIEVKDKTTFLLSSAFSLKKKQHIIVAKSTTPKASSGEYILRDFVLTGLFIDGTESMAMIKDPKGGVFVYINTQHKGYTLIEVYPKKAKFKKGINIYWAFLNPKDEKAFEEVAGVEGDASKSKVTNAVRKTVVREMFEEIKYKDGTFYIPESMLEDMSNIMKHFSTIGIQIYDINGVISFKVNYLASSSVFAKLGLRKRDFITAVNGQKIKSVKEQMKFFQNIQNIKKLSISVKRGNQIKELKYEVY